MRTRAVIQTALAAALGAALVGAGSARAGTYQVLACNAPGGGGVNSSWRLVYSGGASAADFNPDPTGRCAGSDGAQLHTTANPMNVPRGARAAWTFRAPAGDVVTHVTVWRFGQARAGWAVAARAGGHVVERCQGTGSTFCTLGASGFSLNSRQDFAIPSQPVVYWALECAGSPPCPTGTGGKSNARLDLQGARVTVSDPTPPALAAGGTLLAGGYRRSGDPAVLSASDASGVRSLSLLVDGALRATVAERCDDRRPAPCPPSASATLSPGALADGTHTVTALATDAAGNVARADRSVVVDGSPPDARLVGVSGRRIVVSVGDRVSGVAAGRLLVRDRPGAVWRALPTAYARGRLTATADRAAGGLGILVQARDGAGNLLDSVVTSLRLWAHVGGQRHGGWIHGGRVAVPYGRRVSLSGVVATTDGVVLAHQPIVVTAALRRSGARPAPLATTTTDGDGRFTLRLRSGPSRTLSVAYPGGPQLLHRTVGVELRVAAWASMQASRRLLFGRGRVEFSGRLGLRGTRLPAGGKLIDLEAFDAGRWRVFATTRARGRHATWHASYTFSGRPGHYPVRVRIRREAALPYDLGYSRPVVIVVR